MRVRIVNALTDHECVLECPREETVREIRSRYLPLNWHAEAYVWTGLTAEAVDALIDEDDAAAATVAAAPGVAGPGPSSRRGGRGGRGAAGAGDLDADGAHAGEGGAARSGVGPDAAAAAAGGAGLPPPRFVPLDLDRTLDENGVVGAGADDDVDAALDVDEARGSPRPSLPSPPDPRPPPPPLPCLPPTPHLLPPPRPQDFYHACLRLCWADDLTVA